LHWSNKTHITLRITFERSRENGADGVMKDREPGEGREILREKLPGIEGLTLCEPPKQFFKEDRCVKWYGPDHNVPYLLLTTSKKASRSRRGSLQAIARGGVSDGQNCQARQNQICASAINPLRASTFTSDPAQFGQNSRDHYHLVIYYFGIKCGNSVNDESVSHVSSDFQKTGSPVWEGRRPDDIGRIIDSLKVRLLTQFEPLCAICKEIEFQIPPLSNYPFLGKRPILPRCERVTRGSVLAEVWDLPCQPHSKTTRRVHRRSIAKAEAIASRPIILTTFVGAANLASTVAANESLLRGSAAECVIIAASDTTSIKGTQMLPTVTTGYTINKWIPGDHTPEAIAIRSNSNTSLTDWWGYWSYC
jgi:hypothetical protein